VYIVSYNKLSAYKEVFGRFSRNTHAARQAAEQPSTGVATWK